jgi:hypothetical protein
MCDVPSIAVFCSESIACFPGTASKFFFKLLYYYYYYYYYYVMANLPAIMRAIKNNDFVLFYLFLILPSSAYSL